MLNPLVLKKNIMITVMSCRRGGPVLPGAANKTGVIPATSKPSSEQVVVKMLVVIMMLVVVMMLVIMMLVSMMLSWY